MIAQFGHFRFDMPFRCPGGDFEEAVEYISEVQRRSLGLGI